MKKALLALPLSLLALHSAFAQQPITGVHARALPAAAPASNTVLNYTDTIDDYLLRATGFYALTAGSSGYVLGTSNVTTETGCHYTSVGNARVTDLFVYFTDKYIMNTADNITCTVYQAGPDSMPTTVLGTGSFSVSLIDTSGFPSVVNIPNGTPYNGDFFVSVSYGSIDDSVSIFSTNPTTTSGGPDGAGERRVRQNTSLGWLRAYDIWTIGGVGYNADALILPVVDVASGTGNEFTMNGFSLRAPYPSPAAETVVFPVTVDGDQEVGLTVYNQLGQPVREEKLGRCSGQLNYRMDVASIAAGTYFCVFSGAKGKIAARFTVAK